MSKLREIAYRVDPVIWVREVLGVEPAAWQAEFLRAPQGSSILALTARQVGKTTTAAWAMAHTALHVPNSLSVVACPAQRQSAEPVRRVKESLIKAGVKLKNDNVYGVELENGARVLALPGSDDSVRGLTVDGWIIADEAARLTSDSDCGGAAHAGAATEGPIGNAVDRLEPHRSVLDGLEQRRPFVDPPAGDRRYRRDAFCGRLLEQERQALGEDDFKREYLGIPAGSHTSPFTWEMYEQATHVHVPKVAPGRGFMPTEEPPVPIANPFRNLRTAGVVR
jgi:hypothetical protein